jgi:hypothetical protein
VHTDTSEPSRRYVLPPFSIVPAAGEPPWVKRNLPTAFDNVPPSLALSLLLDHAALSPRIRLGARVWKPGHPAWLSVTTVEPCRVIPFDIPSSLYLYAPVLGVGLVGLKWIPYGQNTQHCLPSEVITLHRLYFGLNSAYALAHTPR